MGTMQAVLRAPFVLEDTPAGTRSIFEVERGEVDGPRLRATLHGRAAADWLVVGPDGTGSLDVRALMQTHDGALVFVHYGGRVDATDPRPPSTPRPSSTPATTATAGSTGCKRSPRATSTGAR